MSSECNNCQLQKEGDNPLCKQCKRLNRIGISVSPITEGDLELILAWRSNPEIYRYFRQQEGPLKWEDHEEWFNSRDSNRYDFMITFEGRKVGVISLSADNEVGIYIGDLSAQGKGVATSVLEWLCERLEHRTPFSAEVHQDNESSQRLFERCGFSKESTRGKWIQYIYRG